jgi:hypothetical protein
MSDPYPFGPLLDPEGYDPGKAAEAEYDRREGQIIQQFIDLVTEAQLLWGEREALTHLQAMLNHDRFKPEKHKKSGYDPAFDLELVAAHRDAAAGLKMAAVFALGKERGLSPETTERRLRRLLQSKRKFDGSFAQVRDEWRRIRDQQQEG